MIQVTSVINVFRKENFFLSNFYPARVEYEGKVYETSEHAFQAAKTLDEDEREWVRLADGPAEAKARGRKVTLRPDWDERIATKKMAAILKKKFSDPELRQQLLNTKGKLLIEGNYWHDNKWGVCLCTKCPGEGDNTLGLILSMIREVVKNAT